MKKKFTPVLICIAALATVLIAVMVLNGQPSAQAPLAATPAPAPKATQAPVAETTVVPVAESVAVSAAKTNEAYHTVILAYDVAVQLPAGYEDVLVHTQKTQGERIEESFAMRVGEMEIPLYRICFGGADGNRLGALRTEAGEIDVTYEVLPLPENQLAAMNAETVGIYDVMLDSVNAVFDGFAADSRFSAGNHSVADSRAAAERTDAEEYQTAEMTFWTVSLPAGMTWTEYADESSYRAVFSGMIRNEVVELYSVHVGGEAASSVLGTVTVDGEARTVSVESFDLSRHEGWSEPDFEKAYLMLDSINDIIQVIVESDSFSN